jgi:hypothetical protein
MVEVVGGPKTYTHDEGRIQGPEPLKGNFVESIGVFLGKLDSGV